MRWKRVLRVWGLTWSVVGAMLLTLPEAMRESNIPITMLPLMLVPVWIAAAVGAVVFMWFCSEGGHRSPVKRAVVGTMAGLVASIGVMGMGLRPDVAASIGALAGLVSGVLSVNRADVGEGPSEKPGSRLSM